MISPTITEREVSRLEAEAGLQARAAAEHQGGDPAQISALVRAAQAMPPAALEPKEMIGGVSLHRNALLVTLCCGELQRLSAQASAPPSNLLVITRLAACFHNPTRAWQDLTDSGLAALDAWAVALVAHWMPEDVKRFTDYVELLRRRSPSLQADDDNAPGKSSRKVKQG